MALTDVIERGLELILTPIMDRIMRALRRQGREMAKANPRLGSDLMLKAYREGDYQNALALSRIAGNCGVDMGVFQGSALMQIGLLEEAEKTLLQAVAAPQADPKLAALANCVLGELFLLQQRLERALGCFTTALNLWPERAATHRHMAEVWLRKDMGSEALSWARRAVEKEKADAGVTAETKAANLATGIATLAWAVAAEGDAGEPGEAEKLAAEAAALCGGLPVTSVAQVHVNLGMAYTLLGDPAKGAGHFETAAQADPHGAWGREGQRLGSEILRMR